MLVGQVILGVQLYVRAVEGYTCSEVDVGTRAGGGKMACVCIVVFVVNLLGWLLVLLLHNTR